MVKVNLFQELKLRAQLIKVFRNAGIYKTVGSNERKIYPKIQRIKESNRFIKITFSLPVGVDPGLLKKKYYIFEQTFGERINLDGDIKFFVLAIQKPKCEGETNELIYSPEEIKKAITGARLGVICGVDASGEYVTLDLTEQPHILIAGETGSGKSTQIRSIVTTWILTKTPHELELYMGDCKKSEFHIFRRVEHVKCVLSKPVEIGRMLKEIKREMDKRSDLTEMFEVAHIDDLPPEHRKPYIVVCIDEFVLLRKDEDIMNILIDIVCVGRTLGVFAILSMQRPNAKTLDTTIRAQCTVAMGFQLRDITEARIVNTLGAEKLNEPGYFVMNSDGVYSLQAPYLELEKAKELLDPFCVMKQPAKTVDPQSEQLTERDVFNDVE